MGCLTIKSPIDWNDCLELGGARGLMRKAAIYMRATGNSVGVLDDGVLIAAVFLVPNDAGEIEFALSLRAGARERMASLVRLAHLTLGQITDTGAVIICHVMPGNRAGVRMARLTGFYPDGETRWIWRGRHDGSCKGIVRGECGGEGCSGKEPTVATDR